MPTPRQIQWIDRLDADHRNLRAALEFCLSQPGEAAELAYGA